MILIGQFDSPFVRRVGIALRLYDMPFEHQPWSAFGDKEKLQFHNPLSRVPTLLLDNGEALIDSHAILDYLDGLLEPANRLFPVHEPQRHQALHIAALATGFADKAVSLFYEKVLHAQVSDSWVQRCTSQITSTIDVLEARCAALQTPFWFGERPGHADIAVTCCLRFLNDAHPGLIDMAQRPTLQAFAAKLEATPVFMEISQAFVPPA